MVKNSFSKYRLRECAHDVVDNRGKNPPSGYLSEGEYPVLDNYLIQNTLYPDLKKVKRYINQETHDNFLRGYLEKDDVIVTLVGNGICNASLSPSSNVVIIQNTIGIKTNEKLVNRFLYYYLLHNQKALIKLDRGSSQPSVNKNDLLDFEIEIPDISTQQKIVAALSVLDTKIELDTRINAELESMAKTIYDYWFVQYDFPDKNGKPYKSSGGKMIWNAELKREIPEGWQSKKLRELAIIIMGQSPKGESYNTEEKGAPLINGAADYEGKLLFPNVYTTEPTRVCQKGDMVFCIRATIGNLTFAEKVFCLGRGVATVRPGNSWLTEQIYFRLLQEIERFKKQATGSIIAGITKDDLTDSLLAVPPDSISKQFHLLLAPLFTEQRLINFENHELSVLRDWLIPMLMNGQVKVN